jgi:hypothetical protein
LEEKFDALYGTFNAAYKKVRSPLIEEVQETDAAIEGLHQDAEDKRAEEENLLEEELRQQQKVKEYANSDKLYMSRFYMLYLAVLRNNTGATFKDSSLGKQLEARLEAMKEVSTAEYIYRSTTGNNFKPKSKLMKLAEDPRLTSQQQALVRKIFQ